MGESPKLSGFFPASCDLCARWWVHGDNPVCVRENEKKSKRANEQTNRWNMFHVRWQHFEREKEKTLQQWNEITISNSVNCQ